MQELPKPWFDLQAYKKTRLLEAKYEAEITGRFLEEGLIRNAAGKAYRAWKALVAGVSVDYRDKLRGVFKGYAVTCYDSVARTLSHFDVEYLGEFSEYISKFTGVETHVFKVKDPGFEGKARAALGEKELNAC